MEFVESESLWFFVVSEYQIEEKIRFCGILVIFEHLGVVHQA